MSIQPVIRSGDSFMRPGGGKEKGSEYEREIAKMLSTWISNGERKDLLWRSEISGGRFTRSTRLGVKTGNPGDIVATHPLAFELCNQYVIECKHWKQLDMLQFLQGHGELWDALQKVLKEGELENKGSLLIAKQNHFPEFLIARFKEDITVSTNALDIIWRHCGLPGGVYILKLDTFLKSTSPDMLLKDKLVGGYVAGGKAF